MMLDDLKHDPTWPHAPACLDAATAILTDRGERPAESFAIGDIVITAFGQPRRVKWVGRRSYASRFVAAHPALHPIRLAAGALGRQIPRRDLYVSPQLGFYFGGSLIPAWCLVNGSSVRPVRPDTDLHYVQLELDGHEILLAEGAPTETYVENGNRQAFHNAEEYHAHYPHASAVGNARFAPLRAGGAHVDSVRAHLARRSLRRYGRLIGKIEAADARGVAGWAWQPEYPAQPVWLEVVVNRQVVGTVLADRPRTDVAAQGLPWRRCGFRSVWPRQMFAQHAYRVEVRRLADHAPIAGSPRTMFLPHDGAAIALYFRNIARRRGDNPQPDAGPS
jgi:hypothetical protein